MRDRKPPLTARQRNGLHRALSMYAPEGKAIPDLTVPERKYTKRLRAEDDPLERDIQKGVLFWWRHNHERFGLPKFALYHVPQGYGNDPIRGAQLKALGLRSGIPDLVLAAASGIYHGLYLELKDKRGTLSDTQQEVMSYLSLAGYATGICRTVESALDRIEQYLKGAL